MRFEIITMHNVPFIGVAKEIAMTKGSEECPKFWNEFFQNLVKPVLDGAKPNAVQKAVFDNHIGQYAVCDCDLAFKNCSKCNEKALVECGGRFRYIIAGKYEGGNTPQGMTLVSLPEGEWIKFHFDGGMSRFQEQYTLVFNEWIPGHKDIVSEADMLVEWYDGEEITSSDFKCGVMLHIKKDFGYSSAISL